MSIFSAVNGEPTWPPKGMEGIWNTVEMNAAFRDGVEKLIRNLASVRGYIGGDFETSYFMSNLPMLMARTVADFIAAEPARVTHTDQEAVEEIIRRNRLNTRLRAAVTTGVSETGYYGKAYLNPKTPRGKQGVLIEFLSQARVIPSFENYDELVEATIVHEWDVAKDRKLRLLERHTAGYVYMNAYLGSGRYQGEEVNLKDWPQTEKYEPVTATGVDELLVKYFPSHQETNSPLGVSIYNGLWDFFLAVNEALTIGQTNLRMTEPRLFVDERLLDEERNLSAGRGIIAMPPGDNITEAPLVKPVEFDFKADQYIAYQQFLVEQALLNAGIDPAATGWMKDGGAPSGTALRLRMAHTLVEVAALAQNVSEGLADLLRVAAKLDARVNKGKWSKPDETPVVELQDGLPADIVEMANAIALLDRAEAITQEDKLRLWNGDLTDEKVQEKLAQIRKEREAATQALAGQLKPPTLQAGGLLGPNGSLLGGQ